MVMISRSKHISIREPVAEGSIAVMEVSFWDESTQPSINIKVPDQRTLFLSHKEATALLRCLEAWLKEVAS